MLDVKITGYVVPVAEQPQASLTPVIAIANVADEGAIITGLIRIYRESTGLLIYQSELAVTQLDHHSTTNIAALTPFDPPAPADDDYFVKADIIASSFLPGPPITDSLGAWHFDIKTPPMGEAPAGHHVTHEEDGSDEIEASALGTTEMDDTLRLAPDGTGGAHWVTAVGAHATSHEAGGADVVNHDAVEFAKIHPAADSTTAVRILKADNTTPVVTVDTTNTRVGIGTTPSSPLHVLYSGADGTIPLQVDASASSISGSPGFYVLLPTTGLQKGFQLANSGGVAGWASFDFSSGGAAKPGFSLGPSTGVRDVGLARETTGTLRVSNASTGAATLLAGKIGITASAATPTALLDVSSDIIRLRTAKTPATAGAAGNAGDICWDADFIYVCIDTNTWTRVAIATWV